MNTIAPDINTISNNSTCPVCSGTTFGSVGRRPFGRCLSCGTMERHRLLWKILQALDVVKPSVRILHLAPERAIGIRLFRIARENYYPADFQPERFHCKAYKAHFLDGCSSLKDFENGRFDLIIHNHILEHLPCSVPPVIDHLQRILAPGGWHLFSVPFRGPALQEDWTFDAAQRKEFYGQEGHYRLFGTADFPALLKERWNITKFPVEEYFTEEELKSAGIPYSFRHRPPNGNDLFVGRANG